MIEDGSTKQPWMKTYAEWNIFDKEGYEANSCALSTIYCALCIPEFNRISTCATAKEAWDALQTTHEGTKTVKTYKIQMLTTRFEELRMSEDESFVSFITKLSGIVNSFQA